MDENRPMTKRELKAQRRLEKLDRESSQNKQNTVKWIILSVGSVIFIAFFALVVFLVKQNKSQPVQMTSDGWVRGSASASATLVEFGDFQCPACKMYEPIVQNLLKDFNGDLKLIFKHFPLTSVHPNALLAARAAEAAGAQGKFWEMHDFLYGQQESWAGLASNEAREKMISQAESLSLDPDRFRADLDGSETEAVVSAQQNEGINLGVSATPTFFLNNKKLDNPKDYEAFKRVVEEELK